MNRKDFYNDNRKERRIDFLGDYRVVRKYLCRKHDLEAGEFEFLCKLHALDKFIKQDFLEHKHTISWNQRLWDDMFGTWIKVWRERKPSEGQNYKIYTITRKCKNMIEECYKILCGEIPIPEDIRKNPIMKKSTYQDKRYAKAIQLFNATRNKRE